MDVEQHYGDYQPINPEECSGGFGKRPHGEEGQDPSALYDQMFIWRLQGFKSEYQPEQQYPSKDDGQDERDGPQKPSLKHGMHDRIVHVSVQQQPVSLEAVAEHGRVFE